MLCRRRSRSGRLPIVRLILLALQHCCAASDDGFRGLLRRQRYHLAFPEPRGSETKVQVLFGLGLPMEGEVSMTLGYVLKCNYALPYNSSYLAPDDVVDGAKAEPTSGVNQLSRWSLYGTLESALGRGCLLRAVCEAAAAPFVSAARHGLLGELLRLLLAPSASAEEYERYADREYSAAEERGKIGECGAFRDDCPHDVLGYFTRLAEL